MTLSTALQLGVIDVQAPGGVLAAIHQALDEADSAEADEIALAAGKPQAPPDTQAATSPAVPAATTASVAVPQVRTFCVDSAGDCAPYGSAWCRRDTVGGAWYSYVTVSIASAVDGAAVSTVGCLDAISVYTTRDP